MPRGYDQMRAFQQNMNAELERNSQKESQTQGASQAKFAKKLDEAITGEEDKAGNDLVAAQKEQQLPNQREAVGRSTVDGSSRDELENYARVSAERRGSREFDEAFARDQVGRERGQAEAARNPFVSREGAGGRQAGMISSEREARAAPLAGQETLPREHVSELDKQKILAEMRAAQEGTLAGLSGPPATGGVNAPGAPPLPAAPPQQVPQGDLAFQPPLATSVPSPVYANPGAPDVRELDAAANLERYRR